MKVLVIHPGLQHSHQLAWALEEQGLLLGLWTGIPVGDSRHSQRNIWKPFYKRLRLIPVSAEKRKHCAIAPLLQRLGSFFLSGRLSRAWGSLIDCLYGICASYLIRCYRPDVIICYENSALHCFQRAKKLNIFCVLDAASVHYQFQKKWFADVTPVDFEWIYRKKEKEIELADLIITCSDLAAETYMAAGVDTKKLFSVPLGTNLPDISTKEKALHGPCRFVFVGSISRHKSVDLLINIFQQFSRNNIEATLTLIGGVVEKDLVEKAALLPNISFHPFVPHKELYSKIAQYDCLVLTSRFDSFGMVVPEAMAVGVPVIVSDRVGAKSIIEKHPGAGWIVSCDLDSIKGQLLSLIRQRQKLQQASAIARKAAENYSWSSYRRRVVDVLKKGYSRSLSSSADI